MRRLGPDRAAPEAGTPGDVARPAITQADYLAWRQCPKLAWHRFNAPEQLAAPDAASQALMKRGQEAARLAWNLFPCGKLIGSSGDAVRDRQRTAEALSARLPLFEATFEAGPALIRADVLVPVETDAWDLIELKSGTQAEDVHLQGLAFQTHVLRAAGLKSGRCHLGHLNGQYVRRGAIDPRQLLVIENVSAAVAKLAGVVAPDLPKLDQLRQQRQSPSVAVGPHCEKPFHCPLYAVCWRRVPKTNVFTLYRGGRTAAALFASGIRTIAKIPADVDLTAAQQIQRKVVISGLPHIEAPALRRFLGRLEYPLALLDFETFASAVPMFDGLRPYQQVPFQFSCHIVAAPGAEPEARAWLAKDARDPRREFMETLRRQLPDSGSIVVFSGSFEQSRLAECGEFLPEFRPWLRELEPRFVDLLEPFREFHYHHPVQHGSASIKAVLPALTGKNYDALAIRDGATATLRFMEVTFGKATLAQRRQAWADLEAYCGQDTLAMLWILDALKCLTSAPRVRGSPIPRPCQPTPP